MNVPAWPIPIHQTKLTIANPQATGMLTPQMPTPFARQIGDGVRISTMSRQNGDRRRPTSHARADRAA